MENHFQKYASEALFCMSPSELEAVQEGVLITSADGTILALNAAATVIFGFGKAEIMGRTYRLFQGPGTDAKVLDEIDLAVASGTVFAGVIQNYRKDDAPIWTEMTIFPWHNRQNQVSYFVGVVKDITERKLRQH